MSEEKQTQKTEAIAGNKEEQPFRDPVIKIDSLKALLAFREEFNEKDAKKVFMRKPCRLAPSDIERMHGRAKHIAYLDQRVVNGRKLLVAYDYNVVIVHENKKVMGYPIGWLMADIKEDPKKWVKDRMIAEETEDATKKDA